MCNLAVHFEACCLESWRKLEKTHTNTMEEHVELHTVSILSHYNSTVVNVLLLLHNSSINKILILRKRQFRQIMARQIFCFIFEKHSQKRLRVEHRMTDSPL